MRARARASRAQIEQRKRFYTLFDFGSRQFLLINAKNSHTPIEWKNIRFYKSGDFAQALRVCVRARARACTRAAHETRLFPRCSPERNDGGATLVT